MTTLQTPALAPGQELPDLGPRLYLTVIACLVVLNAIALLTGPLAGNEIPGPLFGVLLVVGVVAVMTHFGISLRLHARVDAEDRVPLMGPLARQWFPMQLALGVGIYDAVRAIRGHTR